VAPANQAELGSLLLTPPNALAVEPPFMANPDNQRTISFLGDKVRAQVLGR
jgi:hypothetical protein